MNAGRLMGASIFTAVAASVCCITPVLALLAGSGSIASSLSWMAPARPYMIGATVALLGFAWYRQLKPQPTDDCGCTVAERPRFIQSKLFLALITAFSVLMLTFPYYAHIFFPKNEKQVVVANNSDIQWAEFKISGMNCQGCEEEVKREVNKLHGIVKVEVSYDEGAAKVRFDKSKTSVQKITDAINLTGYQVTVSELKNYTVMKSIILSLLAISAAATFHSCSSGNAKSESSEEIITFYDVPLVCTAVPDIGCGTRSKPVLLEMEKDLSIKEAWLNRAGTIYAIVWADKDRTDEVAKTIFEKYNLEYKKLSGQEAGRIAPTFREPDKWYRGADVDKLSIEEAGIIAKDAVTFALDKQLITDKEAVTIKTDIENYLKAALVKPKTADELHSNEVTKQFTENLSGIAAKTIGKERADKMTKLYMQTNPLDKKGKGSCCEKKNERDTCSKKK